MTVRPLLFILVLTGLLLAGCAAHSTGDSALPPMDSAPLMKHVVDSYTRFQSFEDSGMIDEVEADVGTTNASHVRYQVQFVRGRAFRTELKADRNFGLGSYASIYYWDGRGWRIYDSINLYYHWNPVLTNADEDDVVSFGTASAYDLVPFVPRLLCLDERMCDAGRFGGGGEISVNDEPESKREESTVEQFAGRQVYRLTLKRDVNIFHAVEDYWIDPQTFVILAQQGHYVNNWESHTQVITRRTSHSTRLNALPADAMIEFNPPPSDPAEKFTAPFLNR